MRILLAEKADLATQIAALERKINECQERKVRNGVGLIAEQQRWSVEERESAIKVIAN